MISRVWTAYIVELDKAARRKAAYVGPALVLLVLVAAFISEPVAHDGVSDYRFVAHLTPLALDNLGFLLILIFSAGLIAPELGDGSIRQVLVRPLWRYEYALAKLAVGMTYALLLSAIVALGTWGAASAFGELSGIQYGGELLYTKDQMCAAYAIGALLDLAPLWAAVAFALMLSALCRNAVTASSAAVGIWIATDLLKGPLNMERFVFFSYLERPWQVFISRCDAFECAWFPMAAECLASSAVVFAVCTGLTMYVLERRNLC